MAEPRRRFAAIWVPSGLFALAFAVRCITWPRVLPGGASGPVFLFGTDAYYHMRRVLWTLANFPATLRLDPYVNFPHGGEPIWPATFDVAIALVALPFASASEPVAVERIAVFVPPALGAATVVALYRIARTAFDREVALGAALALTFLSGHFWYSQLGFVDHHAAVGLLSTLLFGAAIWLFRALADERTVARPATAVGAATAALVLVWPGGLLHVLVVEAALLAACALGRDRARARRAAVASLVANVLAACATLPSAAGSQWTHWSPFSPTVLSWFQPWLFAALALHAGACAAWLGGARGETRSARLAAVLALGVALLAGSVIAFPGLVEGASSALRWLLRGETFQRVVAESRPLFAGADGLATEVAEARLSRFVYVLPVALCVLAWRGARDPRGAPLSFIALWTLALFGATLLQRRFFNSLSVALALVMAWTLVFAWREIVRAWDRRRLATAVAIAAAAWLAWPVSNAYRAPLRNVRQALAGEPLELPPGIVRQRAFHRAASWMRDHTPETDGWLARDARPEYGVLAGWTHGHMIEYVARRPSVADNFGDDVGPDNFLASYRYFESEDDEAARILASLCARYVLFRTAVGPDLLAFPERSMNRRLSAETPDVAHLRLVYDEPMPPRGGRSQIRIFEATSRGDCAARAAARASDAPRGLYTRRSEWTSKPPSSRLRSSPD